MQWKSVADPAYKPLAIGGGDREIADSGQSSHTVFPFEIRPKTGPKQKSYFSMRIGLVDAGMAAAEAVLTFAPTATQRQALEVMANQMKDSDAFGPIAVKAAAEVNAKGKDEFLRTVGRALAYAVLHEFWHVTGRQGDHPYGGGNDRIALLRVNDHAVSA